MEFKFVIRVLKLGFVLLFLHVNKIAVNNNMDNKLQCKFSRLKEGLYQITTLVENH